MSVRLYFPSDLAAPVSPPLNPYWYWDYTTGADRRGCSTTKTSSAFANVSNSPTAVGNWLLRQYISPPFATAVSFLDTDYVKCQFRYMQGVAYPTVDNHPYLVINVVSNDGTEDRLGGAIFTRMTYSIHPTTLTNTTCAADGDYLTTSLDAQQGDRLVIGIGYYAGPVNKVTSTFEVGDNSANDLPENNTDTNQYCPWLEFSTAGLSFSDGSPPAGGSYTRNFPVPNPKTKWQSQLNKRKFPL